MTEKEKEIQKYLDDLDLDRLETDRVMNDLVPLDKAETIRIGRVHKDDDPIQAHLAEERH